MARIASFEWRPIPGRTGGIYVPAAALHPWRFVWHTTEGGNIDSNIGTYARDGWFPHFTAELPNAAGAGGRIAQHIDTGQSATAVSHVVAAVETNRLHCLQVELCGNAVNMPNLSDPQLRWLGEKLIAPLVPGHQFALHAATFLKYPASYGPHAPCRFSDDEWFAFSGVCGHEHIPYDQHGDPGGINAQRACDWAGKLLNPDHPVGGDNKGSGGENMLFQTGKKMAKPFRPPAVFLDEPTHSVWALNGANFSGSQPWGTGHMTVVPTTGGCRARGLIYPLKYDAHGNVIRDPQTGEAARDESKFVVVDERGAEFGPYVFA